MTKMDWKLIKLILLVVLVVVDVVLCVVVWNLWEEVKAQGRMQRDLISYSGIHSDLLIKHFGYEEFHNKEIGRGLTRN